MITRARVALFLLLGGLAGCDETLYTGLEEREANRMVALLRSEDIEASRSLDVESSTYSVAAPSASFSMAIELLERHNLPDMRYASLGDVFKADGLVTSPFEERARFVYAMNQELSKSLSAIEGIADARVHLVIPEDNPLDPGSERARASVFIYHAEGFKLYSELPKIKLAIANSVDKLSYENVTVMASPVQTGLGNR